MTGIDLHTHTTFDHGAHSPEEMVNKALELKMDCIGLTVHAHDLSDEDWTASPERMQAFLAEVNRLKEFFGPKIWRSLLSVTTRVCGNSSSQSFKNACMKWNATIPFRQRSAVP